MAPVERAQGSDGCRSGRCDLGAGGRPGPHFGTGAEGRLAWAFGPVRVPTPGLGPGLSYCPTSLEYPAVKSAVENLNPTRVKLTVEVPFEELKPSLDAAYKTIGSQIQVPGFRKGHVPARVIDQRVGRGAVLQEAVNEALPQFYGQAVEENKVRPIGQPEVDVTEVPAEAGQELKFTVEVDVRPEITLPDFTTLKNEVDKVELADADIDERLTSLRERFGTLVGVERAVETGDFVSIDLDAKIGDEEIDAVTGHLLRGRLGQHARRHGRRAGRDDRRRDQDVHRPVGRRRPRGRGRRGHGDRAVGEGARAARAQRRLRPARLGVRHPRRAQGRRHQAGRARQEDGAGRPGPRQGSRAAARDHRDRRPRQHRRGRGARPPRG